MSAFFIFVHFSIKKENGGRRQRRSRRTPPLPSWLLRSLRPGPGRA